MVRHVLGAHLRHASLLLGIEVVLARMVFYLSPSPSHRRGIKVEYSDSWPVVKLTNAQQQIEISLKESVGPAACRLTFCITSDTKL